MFDPSKILKIFLFYLYIILFLLMQSCEKDFSGLSNGVDTTSHDFQWESFTFGGSGGSSYLQDVAIVNENDIWAVGEIYADSIKPWKPYNAVHWDGNEWELKLIPFIGSCSAVDYPPIRAIWAFAENHILFTNGGAIAVYDGINTQLDCGMNTLLEGAIIKIFATDSSNIYIVGGNGTIVHYDNGSSWQKIESGTDVDFRDIWGAGNPLTGEWEILTVGHGAVLNHDIALLKVEGSSVYALNTNGLPSYLSSLWFIPGQIYYVVGHGVYYAPSLGDNWQPDATHPSLHKVSIRGQAANDIFITSSYGLVSHYNGRSWYHYTGSELPTIYGGYWSISCKEDLMVAVGELDEKGIILEGIRNQ
jgi:hypothetical protein